MRWFFNFSLFAGGLKRANNQENVESISPCQLFQHTYTYSNRKIGKPEKLEFEITILNPIITFHQLPAHPDSQVKDWKHTTENSFLP